MIRSIEIRLRSCTTDEGATKSMSRGRSSKGRLDLPASSVARHGRVHERGPDVDAAAQVVEIPESLTTEVLSGVLAAYAVMAQEDDRRGAIAQEKRIVIGLVAQARAPSIAAIARS